jgi:hypothetical protein
MTGKPSNKVATFGGNDNYFSAVVGSMLNELLVPGKVQDSREDFITENFNDVGYEMDISNLRSYKGIPLTAEQISTLSYDLYDVGTLPQRMKAYFNSPRYKKLLAEYRNFRSDSSIGDTGEGTRSAEIRNRIHNDINAVIREAKQEAVNNGQLQDDESFMLKAHRQAMGLPLNMPTQKNPNGILIPTR